MSISDPTAFFRGAVQPVLEQLGWSGGDFSIGSEPIYTDAGGTVFACSVPASPDLLVALPVGVPEDHARRWLGNLAYNARAPLAVSISRDRALLIAPHMIPVDRGNRDQPDVFSPSVEIELPLPRVLRKVESTDPGRALRQLGITPPEAAEAASHGGVFEATGFRPRDPVDRALMDHLIRIRGELLHEEPTEAATLAEYFRLDEQFLRLVGAFIFIRSIEDRKVHTNLPTGSLLKLARSNNFVAEIGRFTEPLRRLYGAEAVPRINHTWHSVEVLRRFVSMLYFDPEHKAKLNFALLDEDVLATLYQEYLEYLLTDRQQTAQKRLLGNDDRVQEHVRRDLGIYYTPRALVDIVRGVIDSEFPRDRGAPVILDPACGAAAFLRPMMLWLQGRWPHISAEQLAQRFIGVDEDPRAVTLARQALSRTLVKFTENEIPLLKIHQGDFLDPITAGFPTLEKGEWEEVSDVVVGNPPFLSYAQMRKLDPERAAKYRRDFSAAVGKETNLAAFFLFQALRALRPGGLLGMVVPRIMLRGDNYEHLRRELLRRAEVVAVVDFGVEQIFADASITTAILFLRRRTDELEQPAAMQARSVLMLRYREDFAPLIVRALAGTARTAEIDGVLLNTTCHARSSGAWLLLSDSGEKAEEFLTAGEIAIDSVLKMEYAVDIMAGKGKALLFDEHGDEQGPVVRLWSHHLNKEVLIERKLLRRAIRSDDVQRFRFGGQGLRTYVLYPYGPDGQPIPEDEIFRNPEFTHAAKLLSDLETTLKAVTGRTTGVWYGPRNVRPGAVWHDARARAEFADTVLIRRRFDPISRVAQASVRDGIPIGALLTFAVRREYAADTARLLAFFNSSLMSWYLMVTSPEFGRGGYPRTNLATFRPLRFPKEFFDADSAPLQASLAVLSDLNASISAAQILRLEKKVDDWVYSAFGFDDLLRERIRSELLGFTSNAISKNFLYQSAVSRATVETALEVGSG